MSPNQQALTFIESRKTLYLSTSSKTGELETSVAPFVSYGGDFYIYVSELSQHTKNLLAQEKNTPVSALLCADEKETEQLFACERMRLQLNVEEVERSSACYQDVIQQFEQTFGDVVQMLTNLPDFHLFKLRIVNGQYVRGFGQAFRFEGHPENGMQHIGPNS